MSIHDLLKQYIEEGRIKLDKSIHHELTTYHDPCNYGRKGERMFGHGYYEEPRWVAQQCCENLVDMYPNRANNFCCGAGGGAWAAPYVEERIFYGRTKAKQIKDTGAKLVIAPVPQLPRHDHEEPPQGIRLHGRGSEVSLGAGGGFAGH